MQAGFKSRKMRLLLPFALLTIAGLGLLAALAIVLITQFDRTALARERAMVEQGFSQQFKQLDLTIAPQVVWDKAVLKLDHRFDPDFADINFGNQLFTFNGFDHTFFVDGDGQVRYAAVGGKRGPFSAFGPFRGPAAPLLAEVRAAEARRPPIHPGPTGKETVVAPIQRNGIVRVGGQLYIVVASLVEPDTGHVLPRGPRAPVAITAKPIERNMLRAFAAGYLVDDLELVMAGRGPEAKAYLPLHSPLGQEIGTLVWTPRRPGTMLFDHFKVPLFLGLGLLALFGWLVIRRSAGIADDLIASEARARHLAAHDPLTGLPNRALLFRELGARIAAIGQEGRALAVLCIDLDHFKSVNDTLGHQAGDVLLGEVAERLRTASGAGAFIARLGGDEFVVARSVMSEEAALALAERCRAAIMATLDSEYGRIDPGCSIGVALIEDAHAAPSRALRLGDLALYHAKAAGRGCVTLFEPAMDAQQRERSVLEEALRAALRDDQFRIEYQPQVDTRGRVHALEALLRWTHPDLGPVSPARFIPLAEDCGLILPIGEFVLRTVFTQTRDWVKLRVAVNVSPIQLRASGFAARVAELAARTGIDPARYEIELTETSLLADDRATAENIAALRRMGFSIVLDDFGTGYSSLSLLQRFPVNKIKIDRSFVSSLGASPRAEALVRAIVQLAAPFELGVIAEGVETEVQLTLLRGLGCTEFQGYLTGYPMSAAEAGQRFGGGSAQGWTAAA